MFILILALTLFSPMTWAQTYELMDKSADIAGEPQILQNKARESWKNECENWKKELKSLHNGKDSILLAANCNNANCQVDGGRTVCQSKGSYQIRVKMTE